MQIIILSDVQPNCGRNAGAYRIASELRNSGYSVLVVEWFQSLGKEFVFNLLEKHVTSETLWVGFSTTFTSAANSNYEFVTRLKETDGWIDTFMVGSDIQSYFDHIKKLNSKTQIVIGGSKSFHFKLFEEAQLGLKVDWYFHKNSDHCVVPFTDWLAGKAPAPIIVNGNEIYGLGVYEVKDFSQITIDWHDLDWVQPEEYIPIELARGCIFKCKFCDYDLTGKKRGDYTKNLDTMVEELTRNYEKYKVTNYIISDETLNDSMEKAQLIYDISKQLPFKWTFGGYARLDLYWSNIDEMPHMMQEAGLKGHFFGVETFSERAGKAIGKGLGGDRIKETLTQLRKIWDRQVIVELGLIAGLPYESYDEFMETINWIRDPNSPVDYATSLALHIFKGQQSMFGNDPEKYGFRYEDNSRFNWSWGEDLTYQKANQMSKIAALLLGYKNKPGWWLYVELANLNEFTEEELRNTRVADIEYTRLTSAKDRKIQQYKSFLSSL